MKNPETNIRFWIHDLMKANVTMVIDHGQVAVDVASLLLMFLGGTNLFCPHQLVCDPRIELANGGRSSTV